MLVKSALQSSTAIKTSSGWTEGKQLRSTYSDITESTARSFVVGTQPLNEPLSSNPEAGSFSHSEDRCFNSWLGSLLSRVSHEDRRAMVSQRPEKSYQLAGASRSFPSSSEFCSRETRDSCYTDDGQSSSHLVHQEDGGNSLSEALQPCSGTLELVCPEINNSPCRACSMSAECNSRLREQTLQ